MLPSNSTNLVQDVAPAWSSGGTQIAFQSDRDGSSQLYVMNADGTGVTRLTSSAANVDPAWFGAGTTAHIGDLEGSASNDGPTWSATVEITVHGPSHGPLAGATVTGSWSFSGSSATCTTGDTGICVVQIGG